MHIRRAQAAILSPHRSSEDFLDKSYQELKEITESDEDILEFSRNAVMVDIEDPNGTDLFFVDLPGKSNRLLVFILCLVNHSIIL